MGADEIGNEVRHRTIVGRDAVAFVADSRQDIAKMVSQFKELVSPCKYNAIYGSRAAAAVIRVRAVSWV